MSFNYLPIQKDHEELELIRELKRLRKERRKHELEQEIMRERSKANQVMTSWVIDNEDKSFQLF